MTADNDDAAATIPALELLHHDLATHDVATIENADCLEPWQFLPAYMAPGHDTEYPHSDYSSCSYCGVGDSGAATSAENCMPKAKPSAGCVKFEFSRMKRSSAYPIQLAPSIKMPAGGRANINYQNAISKFADVVLDYLNDDSQLLIYACGQIDYFAIFAMQEVFRLLGVRNLTGNAEHCLNAGAVHNEILTGQEGPFVSIEQALAGQDKFYIFNGWNGLVTHPPIFNQLLSKPELNAVLFDVMLTETGQALQNKLGSEHVGLLKPASDPHIALAVAHQIFTRYPDSVDVRFIAQWSDLDSFSQFKKMALSDAYSLANVCKRTAAEPQFEQQLQHTILHIVDKLVAGDKVPVIIPSVGLSQSTGVVAHCLWACVLAILGKFGLDKRSNLLGGVLRLPGQINAESEVQGLSRKYFMGRIPMSDAAEAARRMGLPDDAYEPVLHDEPVAALDYAEPSDKRQLFIFFGTQFEANMPNRKKWLEKLLAAGNAMVVVDPIVDSWSLEHAGLIIPSPPHPATPKLYQNGEWRLSLSVPQKKAPSQTRSDATIIYDLMAEIVARLKRDAALLAKFPHLQPLLHSGYLQQRFCPPENPVDMNTRNAAGLLRVQGEVSRVQLFARVQDYLHGGCGPLYCSFDHENQTPIGWQDLLEQGSIIYGGVGKHRFLLDYDDDRSPFADIYRKPRPFKFFVPTDADLMMPSGVVLNSGRSSLSDNQRRVQFAIKSFNSGKATPVDDIPFEHPLHISQFLALQHQLRTGDWVKLSSAATQQSLLAPVIVSERIFGETVYMSFHRSKAQVLRDFYINDVTDNRARCAYSSQVKLKTPGIYLEKLPLKHLSHQVSATPRHVPSEIRASWDGTPRNFIVSEIIREADNSTSFRLVPEEPCLLDFKPGQYCAIHLHIQGKKQTRAYSISSSPLQHTALDITVKRVPGGLVSNWLPDNLIPGDSLTLGNIGGHFYLDETFTSRKLLFIAAGSGITPFMSMMRWLVVMAPDTDVDFYISARYLSDVLFADELIQIESLMPNANLWIIPTAEEYKDSKEILQGRISADIIRTIAPDVLQREAFMCGPEGFMTAAYNILLELGVNPAQIHQESFGVEKQRPHQVGGRSLQILFGNGADINTTIASDGGMTLLELSDENNLGISSVCRSGICGACLVKVTGETQQEKTEQLTDEQLAEGYRLACICFPKASCQVEIL